MTPANVKHAMHEVDRFLAAANRWLARQKDAAVAGRGPGLATREGGSLRRASLDLSRALADMRRR